MTEYFSQWACVLYYLLIVLLPRIIVFFFVKPRIDERLRIMAFRELYLHNRALAPAA